jgi:hypothetical protein
MAVRDVFKVELYPDPLSGSGMSFNPYYPGEDITSGILNVNIVEGIDIYEGPYQQIDTGQFTIVTRNPNLDPKINANLRYNSRVEFYDERYGQFFRGYVTNIDVEYQRNDNPIITITGTDLFGILQRIVVDESLYNNIIAQSDGPDWTGVSFEEFCVSGGSLGDFIESYLNTDTGTVGDGPSPYPGFNFFVDSNFTVWPMRPAGRLGYSPARYIPQIGETLLDVINRYAITNFNKISTLGNFGIINVYPNVKYDGAYWTPQQDPLTADVPFDFSSDPDDNKPYQSILVDNGYNRVINQIDISNEYKKIVSGEVESFSENLGPYIFAESAENYAVTKASVSTIFPDSPEVLESLGIKFAQTVFQIVGTPSNEVQTITFDNARYEDVQNGTTYSDYFVNRFIRIKHQVSPTETIDRVYEVAGITHNITPDEWQMVFTLKPSFRELAFIYQGQLPELILNSTTGDSNFNFTATIGNYPTENIASVLWDFNQTNPNDTSYYYDSARTGEKFKNGLIRTGLTQTWNFDDDGVLAPYSFNPDRYYVPGETDNRNGGYGPGNWWVTAYIVLLNGYTIVLQQELVVGVPEATANFGWTQNLTNNFGQVSFVDTSTSHEIDEPDAYLWDFGDGNTSSERNPIHVYDPAPDETEYDVSLTVYSYGIGEEKLYNTKTETVTLVQPTMVPDFTWTSFNTTFTFTNTSTNVGFEEPDAYLWDFGDGTTSTLKNPIKTYAAQSGETKSFDVTLTTRNIWEQTETVTKEITFTATFSVGDWPVDSIRFRSGFFTSTANQRVAPLMYNLKGISNENDINLLLNNPVTRSAPATFVWFEADGTTDETNDPLNLTRQVIVGFTPRSTWGLTPKVTEALTNQSFRFDTTLPSSTFTLDNFSLDLEDLTAGNTESWRTVSVEINTNLGWRQVGYFRLGRGRVGDIVTQSGDTFPKITRATRQMTPTRSLPLNYLNFDYTQDPNSRTVRFTTAIPGPWSWDFGDGTTSALVNPVKTYSSNTMEQYDVTLNGVKEIVKLRFPAPFPFRWVRIKLKPHTGVGQYDTLSMYNFSLQTVNGPYISTSGLTNPQSVGAWKVLSGAGGFTAVNNSTIINPLNSQNFTNDTGIRFKTEELDFTSEWDIAIDYKETINTAIEEITWDVNAAGISAPGGLTNVELAEYEIFVSTYLADATPAMQADPSLIPGWLKIGEILPSSGAQLTLQARQQRVMTPL